MEETTARRSSIEGAPTTLKVNFACTCCRKAHKACDGQRPCGRCKRLGITDQCKNSLRKKRGTQSVSKKNMWRKLLTCAARQLSSLSPIATTTSTTLTTTSTTSPTERPLEEMKREEGVVLQSQLFPPPINQSTMVTSSGEGQVQQQRLSPVHHPSAFRSTGSPLSSVDGQQHKSGNHTPLVGSSSHFPISTSSAASSVITASTTSTTPNCERSSRSSREEEEQMRGREMVTKTTVHFTQPITKRDEEEYHFERRTRRKVL